MILLFEMQKITPERSGPRCAVATARIRATTSYYRVVFSVVKQKEEERGRVCQRTCLLRWRPTHGCRTWRSWRLRKSPNRMMKIPWSFSSRCRPPLAPRGLLSLKFQQLESHPAYVRTGVAMPTTGSSCCVAASNLSCDRLPRTGRRGVFGGRIERDRNGQTQVFRVAPVPRWGVLCATGD